MGVDDEEEGAFSEGVVVFKHIGVVGFVVVVEHSGHECGHQHNQHVGAAQVAVVEGLVVGLAAARLDDLHKREEQLVHEPNVHQQDPQTHDLAHVAVVLQPLGFGVDHRDQHRHCQQE